MSIELKQAAQQAIEVLENAPGGCGFLWQIKANEAIAALRTAIQQAEVTDEPVAFGIRASNTGRICQFVSSDNEDEVAQLGEYRKGSVVPLYTHPAPGVPDDVVLTIHELREIQRAVDDFSDCGETDVPDRILMRGVMAGYLECTNYMVVDRDGLRDAIDAAMLAAAQAQKGQP